MFKEAQTQATKISTFCCFISNKVNKKNKNREEKKKKKRGKLIIIYLIKWFNKRTKKIKCQKMIF